MQVTFKIVGLSALAFATIPAALALGASGWLGFTVTAHGFQRTLAQESRRAVYVGAPTAPTTKMTFNIDTHGAVVVEKADLDGRELTVYLRNHSHEHQCYQEVHWALKSPDGTQIKAGSEYIGDSGGGLDPNDRAEGVIRVGEDSRAVSIRLSVSSQSACG